MEPARKFRVIATPLVVVGTLMVGTGLSLNDHAFYIPGGAITLLGILYMIKASREEHRQ